MDEHYWFACYTIHVHDSDIRFQIGRSNVVIRYHEAEIYVLSVKSLLIWLNTFLAGGKLLRLNSIARPIVQHFGLLTKINI